MSENFDEAYRQALESTSPQKGPLPALIREENKSWIDRFQDWLSDQLNQMFGSSQLSEGAKNATAQILMFLIYAALAFLLYYLLKKLYIHYSQKTAIEQKSLKVDFEFEGEPRKTLLKEALAQGNYSKALRILWQDLAENIQCRTPKELFREQRDSPELKLFYRAAYSSPASKEEFQKLSRWIRQIGESLEKR